MSERLLVFLGGLAAALLLIGVALSGLGAFFLFLPTIPLFWIGMRTAPRNTALSALLATFIVSLLSDIPSGLFFLMMLGAPTWYITKYSAWSYDAAETRLWFPIGLIFTHLALYGCGFIALMALFYATGQNSLEQLLADYIRTAFSKADPQYAELVDGLARRWAFVIISMSIWLWGLFLYLHAWATHRFLRARNQAPRPDFSLTPFAMPSWMLFLLGLAAFASVAGSPPMAFAGKTLLMGLLFPYFLLGAGMLQTASKNWPSRGFLLFFIYLIAFSQFWPALAIAGAGVIHHIKRLSVRAN